MTVPALRSAESIAVPAFSQPAAAAVGVLGDVGTRLLSGPVGVRERYDEHRRRLGPLRLPCTDAERAATIDLVALAGLVGRGGGEYPLAGKLKAAVKAPGIPIVVVNGSESEPASRKDHTLLEYRTHLVLDGAVLAANAVGSPQVVVYLHEDSGRTYAAVIAAVRERLPSAPGEPNIVVTTCASGFVAGESSAIVSALSGGPAMPKRKLQPAAVSGIHGRPTVVSNVETLAHLGLLARFGPDWFRTAGSLETPGSTLLTLAGGVARPGLVVETTAPVMMSTVLSAHGGLTHAPRAVLVGGYGGRWISGNAAWHTPLDRAVLRRAGVGLGCGLLAPLPAQACGLEVTVKLLGYLAGESAGQCGSCLFGLPRLSWQLQAIVDGTATRGEVRRVNEVAQTVVGRGACAHPDGAVALLESALEVFRDDVRAHMRGRHCGGDTSGWFPIPGDNTPTDPS